MKTVCVYHSIDLDGWMSAAIVKYWFESINDYPDNIGKGTIDFIGYNYGQAVPDLSEFDKVIMCDISFPAETMTMLHQKLNKNFIWIDHHISAMKDNQKYGTTFCEGERNVLNAACELAWMYFMYPQPMPEIVRLLGRYDCFGHKGTAEEKKVLEFQYGARQCIVNYEEAYQALIVSMEDDNKYIETVHDNGVSIYKYLCSDAKQSYKNGFPIFFEPNEVQPAMYKFICINKERFNPINFGIKYHEEGYDGAACFHFANGKYYFSLYNDNDKVDVSLIAKQFGGGGHKGAAGMVLTPKQFMEILDL